MPWASMGEGEMVWVDDAAASTADMNSTDIINQNAAQSRERANYKNWMTPAASYEYTPEQLGWSTDEAKRFADAGITKLPSYMQKARLYGGEVSLGGDDPIQTFIDANQQPTYEMGGKVTEALAAMGNPDLSAWDDEAQRAYAQAYTDRKWKTNSGTFKESILPAMQSIGSMLAVAAPAVVGAATAPAIAAEVGASGLTAAEASAMLGESAAGYGAAGAGGGIAAGGTGALESLAGLGSNVAGFSSTTPAVSEAVSSGIAAGADVGMGSGTSLLTDLGLPATYGSGLGGLADYTTDMLFGGGSSSSGDKSSMGILDSLFGGGSSKTGGSWLDTLLGIGGGVAGGVMGADAMNDAIDKALKNYEPFRDLGVSNIPALNASDPTGGAGRFTTELEALGKNFTFDPNDPAYKFKTDEATRLNNQNLAARGMYNSRAGLNLLDQSGRAIMADEYDKQYNRKYTNLMDLFNMTSKTGATDYNKLLDMVKIGSGAASSAGNADIAGGQVNSNLWSGLGSMPLNYLLLNKMLNPSAS